jgi:two-component system, cell cycle response regulator DivK
MDGITPRLVIIDDDEDWGRLAKRRLESAGFDVQFHRGSVGTLNTLREGGFDVILLDVRMPGLEGDRVVHALYHMRLTPRPKVVLCSGIDRDELRVLAKRLKVAASFSKSAGLDELVRLVEGLTQRDENAGTHVAQPMSAPIKCPLCRATPYPQMKRNASPKILLVEDNEMNRDMLARRLERRSYSVVVAANGAQAVAKAEESAPDVIIMDMDLPVMNGLAATSALKRASKTSGIPVLALTAHSVLYDRQHCLDAGADDWDRKPVDFTQLVEKIEGLLLRRRLRAD